MAYERQDDWLGNVGSSRGGDHFQGQGSNSGLARPTTPRFDNIREQPQPLRATLPLFQPQMPGVHGSDDDFQPHSPGFMAAFAEQMNQGFRRVSPVHTINATDRIEFLGTRPIVPLFHPLTKIFLSVDVIAEVKLHANDNMIKSIINTSFFPTDEEVLKMMAQRALDDAISQYSNGKFLSISLFLS